MPQNDPGGTGPQVDVQGWLDDDASPSDASGPCGRCENGDTALCEATQLPHVFHDDRDNANFKQETRWVATLQPIADVYAAQARYLANIASVWDVPKSSLTINRVVPTHVIVVSPNSQGRCAGSYDLVLNPANQQPAYINGAPCYEQRGDSDHVKPKMLYLTATHKRWAIGDGIDDGPFHICSRDYAPTPLDVNHWSTNDVEAWVNDRDVAVLVRGAGPDETSCFIEVQAVVKVTTTGMQSGQGVGQPRDPGTPATSVKPTGFHTGQRVFMKDKSDTEWQRGLVAGMRGGRPYVAQEEQRRDRLWEGALYYDHVRPVVQPQNAQPAARAGARYITQNMLGSYYTIELDAVYDDGVRCRGRLVFCNDHVWRDVLTANLIPAASVQADLIHSSLRGDRPAREGVAPRTRDDAAIDIKTGDTVEVRDCDADAWLSGVVMSVDSRKGPLVSVNAWAQDMRMHHWKQVRKKTVHAGMMAAIPNARRALIVGVSYGLHVRQGNPVVQAAVKLGVTMQNIGFNGDVRVMTDEADTSDLPTAVRIREALGWMARGAKPGDCFFLAFIGGALCPTNDDDRTPPELRPCDFKGRRGITDTDIDREFLSMLPRGCSVTCVFDTAPPTSIFSLPHRVKGQWGRLHFTSVAPAYKIDHVNLTTLSLMENSSAEYFSASTFSGLFADTLSSVLRENPEPSVNELVLQLTVDLDDFALFPLFQTNSVSNATGNTLMTKRFFLGARSRYGADIPCPPIKAIVLRSGGYPAANGTYEVERRGSTAAGHRWVNVTDGSLVVQWDENSWVVKRDLGVTQTYLYKCSTREPCPDPNEAVWSTLDGAAPIPGVELVYGEQLDAGDAAPANEQSATLRKEVWKGRVRYPVGTEVVAVSPVWAGVAAPAIDTYTLIMPDSCTVCNVQRTKLAFPEPEPFGKGDDVAVRDHDGEEWLVAKVLKVLPNGQVMVRPVSEDRMWTRPAGYLFQQIKRVEIGSLAEGKDEHGSWYPIRITKADQDGTYEAEVDDGYEGRYWTRVHPQNIRRKGVEGAGGAAVRTALQCEVKKWAAAKEDTPPTLRHPDMKPAAVGAPGAARRKNPFRKGGIDRAPFDASLAAAVGPHAKRLGRANLGTVALLRKAPAPIDEAAIDEAANEEPVEARVQPDPVGTAYAVNDRVQVRDKGGETWLQGTVLGFDADGNPLVTPDIWPRAKPYKWNFIAAAVPDEPEPSETGDWNSAMFPPQLVVRMPWHSRMCPYRQVRAVRVTPNRTRDPNSLLVALGCLQLLASPVYPMPNPVIKEVLYNTLGNRRVEDHPEYAKSPSYGSWVAEMPANIVFVLEEPQAVFGYRMQTAKDQPASMDMVAWTVEVADGANHGWVMWDEVDGEEGGTQMPEGRSAWTAAVRPQHHYQYDGEYEAACPYSTRCRSLHSLEGTYSILGTQKDAIRGQPVYKRTSGDGEKSFYIYLSSNNSWMITDDADDIAKQNTVGLVRGTDTSVPPHLSKYWEFHVVRGAQTTWQYDPEISVEKAADKK
eukprot:TRINITY_DN18136_c0_g1_i1.p1 TRINITY_DN18136_c0_g1~~TRINITY_DN18136_c0_g1_i1.p1  ORF type:complete len:1535 (+),score=323.96 TRINITY_DN18136_c0_g1_i1:84-4607(+)